MSVLLTGWSAPHGRSIKECLLDGDPGLRVFTADSDPGAEPMFWTPDPAVGNVYDDAVADYCRDNKIEAVVPLSWSDLLPLALRRGNLGAAVMVSPASSVAACLDKEATYRMFPKMAPECRVVRSDKEFLEGCDALGYPKKRLAVKPTRLGGASRGFMVLDEKATVEELFGFGGERITTAGAYVERLSHLTPGYPLPDRFPELLVMEHLPGAEYSVDCLCDDGELLVGIPRRRSRVESGLAVDTTTEDRPDLVEMASKVVKKLDLSYAINVQFREDSHGKPVLLEVNPRMGGTMSVTRAAGVNVPRLAYQLLMGEDFEVGFPRWGVRMKREWKETYPGGSRPSPRPPLASPPSATP